MHEGVKKSTSGTLKKSVFSKTAPHVEPGTDLAMSDIHSMTGL